MSDLTAAPPAPPPPPAPAVKAQAEAVAAVVTPPIAGKATSTAAPPGDGERAPGEKDPDKPDEAKDPAKPKVERDPIVDLVQRLQGASIVLSERDAGLATAIGRLAERSAEPGRRSEPLFRTQVAYSLQDMEKVVGQGRIAVPPELRTEMTRLAGTAPGLENRQMEALVRSTPEIDDRALVRDVRRAAGIIAGLGSDQNSQSVREQIDVLENRVRLAARVAPSEAGSAGASPPEPPAAKPAERPTPATERTRAEASPGDAKRSEPAFPGSEQRRADHAVHDARVVETRPKSLMNGILDSMRSPAGSSPPPWNPPPVPMAERISAFEERLAQGKTDQLIRASEKSGVAYMKSIETFAAGPGAAILGKIDDAAGTEAGGLKTVMSEMKPGGRYANLRSEFDDALQKDRILAASYNQVEKTGQQYGRDRLALAGDFEAKRLNVSQLDVRFQKADEAIGEATSKIPGRTPGKSAMEELGEKVAELLSKAVERVRSMFGRDAAPEHRASASPGMSP